MREEKKREEGDNSGSPGLTFEEAVFIVNNGDLLFLQASSSVHFTVVCIEFSIRPTHRFVVPFAKVHAGTFCLSCLSADNTVPSQTTVFTFARYQRAFLNMES